MSLLQELPIDVVKIDQSFIKRCASDARAAQLVQALIGVSHALAKTVVAEGVETEAQRNFLREQRCEVLQGFLFGRAVPLENLLQQRLPVSFPRAG